MWQASTSAPNSIFIMGSIENYKPSWCYLDQPTVESLANSICQPSSGLLENPDDALCRKCSELPLDQLWTGSRFPSEDLLNATKVVETSESDDINGTAIPPSERDLMKHLCLVR